MPNQLTGTFFDVDPENWKDVVDVPADEPDEIDEVDLESLERPAVIYFDTTPYWRAAADVINAWARYQGVKKLYVNATHEETRHRVQHVSEKYYNGDMQRVQNREKELFYLVEAALSSFRTICAYYKVVPIDLDWLYDCLKEAKDYASYRGKCERRAIRCSQPVSLKEL